MPSYVTCPQIFISTLYSSYNWSLFIEIVFMPTINPTHSILFVRSFHHHLFMLSKQTHYIIRSISQAIILVLSELVTLEVLHHRTMGEKRWSQNLSQWQTRVNNVKLDREIHLCYGGVRNENRQRNLQSN